MHSGITIALKGRKTSAVFRNSISRSKFIGNSNEIRGHRNPGTQYLFNIENEPKSGDTILI